MKEVELTPSTIATCINIAIEQAPHSIIKTVEQFREYDLLSIGEILWHKVSGANWVFLLSSMPELCDVCIWSKIDEVNGWLYLLSHQPQLSAYRLTDPLVE